MKKLDIPVVVEAGSQPADADGVVLDYMQMPREVWTYDVPVVPEPEDVAGLDEALAVLERVNAVLAAYRPGDAPVVIELDHLDATNRTLVDQVLGDGEVSVLFDGAFRARMQESVLAGVWRVQYIDDSDDVQRDVIEVASIPSLVRDAVFEGARERIDFDAAAIPEGVGNAAPILVELEDKQSAFVDCAEPHVVNLTLLPCTDEDLDFLAATLGSGSAVILSRGYGNCRITSTGTHNTWWVQYFNSQDTLILNSIEVSRVPDVACAAPEDLDDSHERLTEILEVYR